MKNGAGTPYIFVTDFEGNIITEQITRFSYVFSEESDDMTTIIFEYSDPLFPDKKAVQENRFLIVKWGYREKPSEYNTKKIYIRECVPDYSESSMTLEIKCTDKASYIRNNKPKKTHEGNPIEITKKIAEENGLTFDENLYISEQDEQTRSKISSNNYDGLPQPGTNDMRFLNDMWNEQDGGPYTVEGREDSLIVRRKNYNQKPKKTITYGKEPRQLLRFKPETKNRMYGKKAKKNTFTYFDPISKTVKTFTIGAAQDKTTRLGEVDKENKDYFISAVLANNTIADNLAEHPDDATPPSQFDKGWGGKYHGESLLNQNDNTNTLPVVTRDKLKQYSPVALSLAGNGDGNGNPGWDAEREMAAAINERQNAANETNPGTAVMIGDPLVECSIIMTFLGIAKKYAGNYYIVRSQHDISRDNGYTVELSFKRNAHRKTGNEGPGNVNMQDTLKVNKTVGGYEVKLNGKTVEVSEDDIKDFQLRKTKSDFEQFSKIDNDVYDRYNNPIDPISGQHY